MLQTAVSKRTETGTEMQEDGEPTVKHPSYPYPVIQEAIIEIGFSLPPEQLVDPQFFGNFFVEVKDEFPNLQPAPIQPMFNIQFGGTPGAPIPVATVMRYQHKSSPILLQLSNSRIVINVLPLYPGWETVLSKIEYAWVRLVKVLSPEVVTRIALRYINRIERKDPGETLSRWLNPTDYVPKGVLSSESGFLLSQIRSRIDDVNRIGVVLSEDLQPGSFGAFIFDIERIAEQAVEPTTVSITNEATRLHDDIWSVFKEAKSERLENLLKGVPV